MRDWKSKTIGFLSALILAWALAACEQSETGDAFDLAGAVWQQQDVGTTASFRGLSVVSHDVIWASGSNGTVIRSLDGGKTWGRITVPGALHLDFRDIQAFDAHTAYVMSIGSGEMSRIYKTTDGGGNWTLQYSVADSQGFLDGMAFWDDRHGMAFGDPVGGHLLAVRTTDGQTWHPVPKDRMPPVRDGEYAFAASGSGIATLGGNLVWFGTGGTAARVFHSQDQGDSWTVAETPITSGAPSAGIFSLAFADANRGIAVGGDYQQPQLAVQNAARTEDGGKTWSLITDNQPAGFRSCVIYLPGSEHTSLLTIGTSGSDYSLDGGLTWTLIDTTGSNVLGFAGGSHVVWTAGPGGFFSRLVPAAAVQAY